MASGSKIDRSTRPGATASAGSTPAARSGQSGSGRPLAAQADPPERDRDAVDYAALAARRRPGPFTPRQLARLDEALTMASRETGIDFSVYVGALDEPTRKAAERLHAGLGPNAVNAALLAVSPAQRVVQVVTGELSRRRLPDRVCALAVLSMEASFSGGDLIGGLVNGLRMLADQAGHPGAGPSSVPVPPSRAAARR